VHFGFIVSIAPRGLGPNIVGSGAFELALIEVHDIPSHIRIVFEYRPRLRMVLISHAEEAARIQIVEEAAIDRLTRS
jgi:hypothetical protein